MAVFLMFCWGWLGDSQNLEKVNQGVQEVYAEVVKDDGTVDYATLHQRQDFMAKLDAFVAFYDQFDPETLPDEKAKIAAYANAYNVFTLVGVMKAWPVESVRKIHPLFGFFTRNKFKINGKKLSLNDIEKKRLQPKDFRIHFIINCASESCPVIQPQVLTAENVEEVMDRAAKAFLADETKNSFQKNTRIWKLSKIFEWYADDWGGEKGVIAYVRKTLPEKADWEPQKIQYLDYDWALNGPTQP